MNVSLFLKETIVSYIILLILESSTIKSKMQVGKSLRYLPKEERTLLLGVSFNSIQYGKK